MQSFSLQPGYFTFAPKFALFLTSFNHLTARLEKLTVTKLSLKIRVHEPVYITCSILTARSMNAAVFVMELLLIEDVSKAALNTFKARPTFCFSILVGLMDCLVSDDSLRRDVTSYSCMLLRSDQRAMQILSW